MWHVPLSTLQNVINIIQSYIIIEQVELVVVKISMARESRDPSYVLGKNTKFRSIVLAREVSTPLEFTTWFSAVSDPSTLSHHLPFPQS